MTMKHEPPSTPAAGGEFSSEQVRLLYPRVLRLARRLVGNPADAEEVVQEALLKAFQHIGGYRREASFSTWLLRITWNEGMEFYRRRSMEVMGLDDLSPGREPRCLWSVLGTTPEQICMRKEIEGLLDRSLRRVPPCYRVVWFLRVRDHLSNSEIAKELGLPESTVKVRMHRAQCHLRRLIRARLSWPSASRPPERNRRFGVTSTENETQVSASPGERPSKT